METHTNTQTFVRRTQENEWKAIECAVQTQIYKRKEKKAARTHVHAHDHQLHSYMVKLCACVLSSSVCDI